MTEQRNSREELKKQVLEDLRKSLTPQELERVKRIREMDKIDRDSNSWPIGLLVDPLRIQFRKAKSVVEKSLWNMEREKNHISRLKQQVMSGQITEQLPNGGPMNEHEIGTQIKYAQWLIEGELQSLPIELWQMRGIVEQQDVGGNIIVSEKEFDEYLEGVRGRVKELGYVLF